MHLSAYRANCRALRLFPIPPSLPALFLCPWMTSARTNCMKLIKNACVCVRQSAVACVCVCVCVVACFCQMGGLKWPAGCCSMPCMGEGKGGRTRLAAGGRNFIHRFINVRNALLATPPPPLHTATQCFYFFVHKCRHIGSGWRWFVGAGTGRDCNNSSSTFLTASISYFQFCMCNFNAGGERESEEWRKEGERETGRDSSQSSLCVYVFSSIARRVPRDCCQLFLLPFFTADENAMKTSLNTL